MNRLKNLVKKFECDKEYYHDYQDILNEQEKRDFSNGFNEKHAEKDLYLARHGVKRESKTILVRIIFDCYAKTNQDDSSLNYCFWTGPPLTPNTTQVLRFCLSRFVCLSDIEKAFLMVQLREEDRDFTQFLWYGNPT